ncbi:MAG: HAMP domain-containing sensor histidine kinase [Bacteroidia bacterium]
MSRELHTLLRRQIRKHFGSPEQVPPELWPFLEAVQDSYVHYEDSQNLLSRAVELSSQELLESNRDLRRKNEMLDAFVYRVSHDLKNPVTSIVALTTMLRSLMPTDMGSPRIQQTIDHISGTAVRMDQRIKDLLDLSRMEQALDAESEELDLQAMLDAVTQDLMPEIERSQAVVEADFSEVAQIRFGRENLNSLLGNLVSNAIKYRSADRSPVVRLKSALSSEFILLTISDNGIGMQVEGNEHKLFGMFQRFHSHVAGTGVGLFIVKKIIERSGGRIEVESTVGEGTTFRIYIADALVEPRFSKVAEAASHPIAQS